MKKFLTFLAIIAMTFSVAACSPRETEPDCDPETMDGTTVCYDSATGTFAVEKGAKIRFGVDNETWGKAIVALWDKTYPELAGTVEYVNSGSQGSTDSVATQQGEWPDVFMAIDGETPRNSSHLLPMHAELAKIVKANSVESFFNAGNATEGVVHYAPMTYDGMAFIWNKTMLEALGLSTADADGDNLPDAFDTWEEIFALSTAWAANRPEYKGKKVNVVFPLTLTNQWSDYHHLTSAGWELFGSGDPTKPGYDDPKFAEGLKFILAAKEAKISVEESGQVSPADSMGWRWDNVINEEIAPFGLVGTWMDVAAAQTTTGSTFMISPVPTYNGINQRPFVKTKGFVINAYTKWRSAATELMRLVYSKDGFQAMVTGTSYAPSLVDGSTLVPTLTAGGIQEQMMSAFVYNYPEPALLLPNNKARKSMDSAYYPFISNTERAIWDGTKTITEAVAELIELSNAAIEADNK